jgi:hypothetical protein
MRICLVLAIAACHTGPAVGVVNMGLPHASRPADCALELTAVTAADMAPGARFGEGGRYEMVGAVTIGADDGTSPYSPEIKQLVRPRACAMGGEVVSLLASGTSANAYGHAQQNIAFQVWAKRSQAASADLTIPY